MARKGDRYYAVIYEGTDPITGRERRRWHPAGTDRGDAERLATVLARRRLDDGYERSSLTVAVYLAQRWLAIEEAQPPGQHLRLLPTQHRTRHHTRDRQGAARRLRPDHLERLYAELADHGRADGAGGLNPRRSSRST